MGQGVASIQDQVKQDLLDLRLVHPDDAQLRIEAQVQRDVFPNQASQKVLHRLGNFVEAQKPDGRGLGAGKNQQIGKSLWKTRHVACFLLDRRNNKLPKTSGKASE